jgi:MoxR-like ATPase
MIADVVDFRGDVPLVGRAPELAALREALATASDGTPGAVLVAGEAGVGKTRLVRELAGELPPDALLLPAQCVDVGDPGPPTSQSRI